MNGALNQEQLTMADKNLTAMHGRGGRGRPPNQGRPAKTARQPLFLFFTFCFSLLLTACPPPVSDDIRAETAAEEGPPGLDGTSWNWGGEGGVKLSFRETTAALAGQSKAYPYQYDVTERTGSIVTLGDFSVSVDLRKLNFGNFNGLGAREFDNSAGEMVGTSWAWGQAFAVFELSRAVINGVRYPYTFNNAAKTGTISGITGAGGFTLSADGTALSVPRWRGSQFPAEFQRAETPTDWDGVLTGTSWGWQNAFNGWMVIEFMSADRCILTHTESTYHDATPWEYVYNWNAATSSGGIPLGTGYSEGYGGLGSFTINPNRSNMNFIQWKDYPHGANFGRIK
jgi:hypothetical protein